jgi:hypothetical protein
MVNWSKTFKILPRVSFAVAVLLWIKSGFLGAFWYVELLPESTNTFLFYLADQSRGLIYAKFSTNFNGESSLFLTTVQNTF